MILAKDNKGMKNKYHEFTDSFSDFIESRRYNMENP